MDKTTISWGVVAGVIALALFTVTTSRPTTSGRELFAAENLTPSDLHPVEQFTVDGSVTSLFEAFTTTGRVYYPEDRISAFPDPSYGLGSVITIHKATPLAVQDGKRRYSIRTWADSLGQVLSENKLDLGDEDRIAPTIETPLSINLAVTITRVARTTVTEKEMIRFETEEKDDPTMWRGERKVTQEGKNGERTKQYLVIREDGELVSKTLTSNVVSFSPKNKIILNGTKLKIGRVLEGKATWYRNNYGTKVAMDAFKKGTTVRVTNLANGKSIIVVNDGCICGAANVLIDLSPEYFQQLGGTLGQGIMTSVRVEEVLN